MSKFKIGDRVVYKSDTSDAYSGTITRQLDGNPFRWYVRWDSEGQELHVDEAYLSLEPPKFSIVNTKIDVAAHALAWGVSHERASTEIQEWLFEQGARWNGEQIIQYTNKNYLYAEGSSERIRLLHGAGDGTFSESSDKEIIISRAYIKPTYSVRWAEPKKEYVELNGKKYLKSDLEDALAKLNPVE